MAYISGGAFLENLDSHGMGSSFSVGHTIQVNAGFEHSEQSKQPLKTRVRERKTEETTKSLSLSSTNC
jgi:hypothetical protein